jgi:hypothetical protein
MTNELRAAAALAVAVAIGGCAFRQKLTVETASNAWACPASQIAVTEMGDNQYRAAGCGKEDVFYCDYVTYDEYTAKQHSELVCRPVKQAVEAQQRSAQIADSCAEMCNRGTLACARGCEDQFCRDACDKMGQGCVEGCVSSSH